MAKKITDLPLADNTTGEELLEIVQNGANKRLPLSAVDASSQLSSIIQSISELQTSKTNQQEYESKILEIDQAIAEIVTQLSGLSSGGDETLNARLEVLEQYLTRVNRLPDAIPVVRSILDTANTISGNVLDSASDIDGDSLIVVSVSYSGILRTPGVQFSGVYGDWQINRDGTYTFTTNNVARALTYGQSATETVSFTIEDAAGGKRVSSITASITGTNFAPAANPDTSVSPTAAVNPVGNVLANDTDSEGDALTLVNFAVQGVAGTHNPGSTVAVPSLGSLTMNQDGSWSFIRSGSSASVVVVQYWVTDGENESSSILNIVLSAGAMNVASNPVTASIEGTRTFNIGPGKEYEEPDTVPWALLQPGDVVNIFHRSTPYITKFGICGQGEANSPIIINGVTDSEGNRPILNGAGARTASGSMLGNGNSVHWPGDESQGVITIKRKPANPTSANPCWIIIQNLEVTGAAHGQPYQRADGTAAQYGFSAGIWVQPANDITIRNCVIYANSQGIFTMAKVGGIGEQCQRIKILYNRIYMNGYAGSGMEHNVYVQGYQTLAEGNYFGWLIKGSSGSSYKSRGSQEIVRYNWVDSGARAIDLVQPDNIYDGFVTFPDFGTDYVYGNVVVNDSGRGGGSYRPIHYGGDNEGELDPEYGGTSTTNYRKHLYFWSNTCFNANPTSQLRQYFFHLSWPETICDAWDNIIVFRGTGSTVPTLLFYAGTLNFRGSNVVHGDKEIEDHAPETNSTYAKVNRIGSIITIDPKFASEVAYDFQLAADSPVLNLSSSLPIGIPAYIGTDFLLEAEPARQSNGVFLRSTVGARDLGALERDPAAESRNKPYVLTLGGYTNDSIYSIDGVVSAVDPIWTFSPTSVGRRWQRFDNTTSQWVYIDNQTGTSITLLADYIPKIRCEFWAENAVGITYSYTDSRIVATTPAAEIVQYGFGYDIYPSVIYNAVVALPAPPQVGSTLVAFLTSGTEVEVTDNYGNIWVSRANLVGYAEYGSRYRCYTCVVATTGSDFTITANNSRKWVSSLGVYEVRGSYAGIVAVVNNSLSVSYNSPNINQRVLLGFSNESYSNGKSADLTGPYIRDQDHVDGPLSHALYHGVSIEEGVNVVEIREGYGDQMSKIIVLLDPL